MALPSTFRSTREISSVAGSGSGDGGVEGTAPLRVVLFTRGGEGLGRTLANEQEIVSALNSIKGVNAIMCCDFKSTSFEKQLAIAYNADAVS